MAVTTPTTSVSRSRYTGRREKPWRWTAAMASAGAAVSGSMTRSTRGTMISRTLVSPRSKILSIISASWVVTSASPGSIWSSAFSSSRDTKARASTRPPPASRITAPTTALATTTKGARRKEVHCSGR